MKEYFGGGGGNRTRVRRAATFRVYRLSPPVKSRQCSPGSPTALPSTTLFTPKQLVPLLKSRCMGWRSSKLMQPQFGERLLTLSS